jgi:hypothetical protein
MDDGLPIQVGLSETRDLNLGLSGELLGRQVTLGQGRDKRRTKCSIVMYCSTISWNHTHTHTFK